jgi:rhodanese-related sulfurtransferase
MILYRACVIVLVGIFAGAAYSTWHAPIVLEPKAPEPIASTQAAPTQAGVAASDAGQPLGLDLTLAQAHSLFTQGVSFIDARHRDEFEAGHVQGAFHMEASEFLSGKTPVALGFLDTQQPVIVYCGGGACDASKNLVVLLQQAGFTRCHIMHDGYPAWKDAGHPTAAGKPEYE